MKSITKTRGLKNKKNQLALIATGTATFLGAFTVAFLASSTFNRAGESYADTISANVKDTSYFIQVNTNPVDIDINATLEGSLATGVDNLQVETNANAYKIYLSSNDDADNSRSLWLNGDTSSAFSIAPGSTTVDSALDDPTLATELESNSWGFIITDNATPTNFFGIRTKNNGTLIVDESGLSGSTVTKSHPVTYGVKADLSVPAGTYSTTVVYSIVAEGGGSKAASVTPATISKDITTGDVELTITTSLMTTYETDAWTVTLIDANDPANTVDCGGVTASIPNNNVVLKCSVPASLAGGNYTVKAENSKYGTYTSTSGALHRATAGPAFYNVTSMQQMTSTACASVDTPAVDASNYDTDGSHKGDTSFIPQITITDTRTPGSSYVIRKLADGNCWMTSDLKLELSTSTALTPDNTDITANWTPSSNTSATLGTWTDAADFSYKSGNYLYNYNAATAGTGSAGLTSNAATASICPKGWQLPAATGAKSLAGLSTAYSDNATTLKSAPTALGTNGRITASAFTDSGIGYYWTKMAASDSAKAISLKIDSAVDSAFEGAKSDGYSIRCVAK